MKTKSIKKGLLLISSITLFSITSVTAAPVMVKCEGVRDEPGECRKGCSAKQPSSKVTTVEECKRQGGKAVLIEIPDKTD